MKKEIMEKWVKLLESGELKQGKNQLRNKDNKFCCLGVLCNLHAQEHPEIAKNETEPTRYLGHTAYLPPEVKKWAGMSGSTGAFVDGVHSSLSSLNDSGKTFKQIAKIIRENYEML